MASQPFVASAWASLHWASPFLAGAPKRTVRNLACSHIVGNPAMVVRGSDLHRHHRTVNLPGAGDWAGLPLKPPGRATTQP